MAYGTDVSVFVEDRAGDLGAPASPAPWWLSPDVDIPAHSGIAYQGSNQVQIRVHAQEEPILEEKVVAEVYAGDPSLVMSPTSGTKRIDPGNLRFRPSGASGTEPILSQAGATLTFPWQPASAASDPAGPGHRCLVLRAFPEGVTPPTANFDVPNEQHEAQHNLDVLSTSIGGSGKRGDGVPGNPRPRGDFGLWWEEILTRSIEKRRRGIIVWAFDPRPNSKIELAVKKILGRRKFAGFASEPPRAVVIDPGKTGEVIDPASLLSKKRFARASGLGEGLFGAKRLQVAAAIDLGPRRATTLRIGFDHSNIRPLQGVVFHGAQWDETGRAEGGITLVGLAPTRR